MKVALLTFNAGFGGVVSVVWQLARGLKARGHDVLVMCDEGGALPQLAEMGIAHSRVPFDRGVRGIFAEQRDTRRSLLQFRPDLIHTHSRWPAMVCRVAGRRPDVHTLHLDKITSHGSVLDVGPLRRWLSVWGRWVTALDGTTREMLIRDQGLDPDRVIVVPNGVDPTRFPSVSAEQRTAARHELGLGETDRVACFVGAMLRWKRPDLCVRALAEAVRRGVHTAKLVVAGAGEMLDGCRALAAELDVADRCVFTGWRDPSDVYRAADLLVLASETEGFGLVCVEAMLCGVPVLRTRRGGCDLQIIEGQTGWSVDVGDEAGLFEKFSDALRDPQVTRRCGETARRHALDNFTEEQFLRNTLAVYERALATR